MLGGNALWYEIVQSFCESLLISMLMFFWVLLIHSIACQDNLITIDHARFWYPKVVICAGLFLYLIYMRLFIYIKYSQDPFFDLVEERHLSAYYAILHSVGIVLLVVYVIYFFIILIKALKTIRRLKKTYRYSAGITIFIMSISGCLLIGNG